MLIQANYQQIRIKNNSTKANESDNDNNNNDAAADKDESNNENANKNAAESKPEANEANATSNELSTDVEMTDVSDAVPAIKTEPVDDSLGDNDGSEKNTTANATAEKMDVDDEKSDCENVIKTEIEESALANSNTSDETKDVSVEDGAKNADGDPVKVEDTSTTDSDDPYSKDIDIDPRTYCKLGHFHLLLEDYTKGECFVI